MKEELPVAMKTMTLYCIYAMVFGLLSGCGTSDSSGDQKNTSQHQGGGIVAGKIETWIDHEQQGDTIHFTFHLKNQTEHVKTYHFNTGQRFDFVIKDEQGKVVKRFSEGKMFTQVLGEETLKQGDTLTYQAKVSGLRQGKYTVRFWLTAKEEQPEATLTFKVE
jgi:hypothetical protein